MPEQYGTYQYEIYLKGLSGEKPDLPMDPAAMAARAAEVMTPEAHGYVDGGASSEDTMRANLEVLFDSGIRTGSDVLKALALGARCVLLGRPYAHGLAVGGEEGVRQVLRCLLADLDLALALSGHTTPGELTRGDLVRIDR